MKKFYFTTSNAKKIEEIQRILPEVEIRNGADLPEVLSDWKTVITYKSLDSDKYSVVEDTIMTVDGEEIVDIKWNIDNGKLKSTQKFSWRTSLAYNDGENIYIFSGVTNGIIVEPKTEGYGFDPYLLPDGCEVTVADLEKIENKDYIFPINKILIYFF